MKLICIAALLLFVSCNNTETKLRDDEVIGAGQMPNVVVTDNGINIVYGKGDSIMYSTSQKKADVTPPSLIAVLPQLAAAHTRGPQIAAIENGLLLTACTKQGNIFSYYKEGDGGWKQGGRVNDQDTVAKENLMALGADGKLAYAVWLDLRAGANRIYGSRSTDGGKSWSKNILVYASPDTTVCECCKPSVSVKGNNVYIMFRNWLGGNRDLHLVSSNDGGQSFGGAQKLGQGSWALKGCPMDGGGLVIDKNGNPQTVWNRKGKIFACVPGELETEIGTGRSCTMASVNGKNVYAWVENGQVVVRSLKGLIKNLGDGSMPVIKGIGNEHVLCVWEKDEHIHSAVVEL